MRDSNFHIIGTVCSPFREKFGIPRQPGLAPHATSRLILHDEYARRECVEGLDTYSHLWLVFLFHATAGQGWQPTVRPPRLGGNKRIGVFASRSMFRPNPVGLSVVELLEIVEGEAGCELVLRGADLLDGTPVIDIKPYLPYADSLPDARAALAAQAPARLPVVWNAEALADAAQWQLTADMHALIDEVLAQDPRPAYHNTGTAGREYGVALSDFNVRFHVVDGSVHVLRVLPVAH